MLSELQINFCFLKDNNYHNKGLPLNLNKPKSKSRNQAKKPKICLFMHLLYNNTMELNGQILATKFKLEIIEQRKMWDDYASEISFGFENLLIINYILNDIIWGGKYMHVQIYYFRYSLKSNNNKFTDFKTLANSMW